MSETSETKPVIMRITAIYEYELVPDLTERQAAYGTTDPLGCAQVDIETANDLDGLTALISSAEMMMLTIEPVTVKEA